MSQFVCEWEAEKIPFSTRRRTPPPSPPPSILLFSSILTSELKWKWLQRLMAGENVTTPLPPIMENAFNVFLPFLSDPGPIIVYPTHYSPWCKKRGGFWWSNFKKWETLRSSFHKLRTSLFHCRVQNRGPESARDLFSLTQDLTFLNYWHRNRGPEFTHAFFSTLNGTKEANTSLMPFLDSRLKIPQWKEIIHYDSHEEKALPSCES